MSEGSEHKGVKPNGKINLYLINIYMYLIVRMDEIGFYGALEWSSYYILYN